MGNRQGARAHVTLGKSRTEERGTRGGKNKNKRKRKEKYGTGEKLQPSNSNEGTTPEDGQPLVATSNEERNVDASKNDRVVDASKNDDIVDASKNDDVVDASKNDDLVDASKNDDVVDASKNDDVVDASKNVDVVDASKTDGAGVASIDERETEFPFENLVFEGGGNKGLAYVGCLKYLEKKDFMRYIRRVGGTSAGAITAALVALGYSADEIEQFLSENIRDVFLDHSCGYLSLLPNLMRMYGWNPGRKIYRWFGDKIKVKSKTQNPDMTFMDLYKERNGKELCVVVTNVSQQRTEYFHPKTTPNVPIRVALRMSMAIPGVFAPRKYEINGQTDLYVDGGVLNNYPVNCFDGWYLSMKPSDGLFERAESPYELMEKKSLDKFNEKTLGFLLYEDTEGEVMRPILEARNNCLNPEVPSRLTRLFERKKPERAAMKQAMEDYKAKREATIKLFDALKEIHGRKTTDSINKAGLTEDVERVLIENNSEEDKDYIGKEELTEALERAGFSEQRARLFGNDTCDEVFNRLDTNKNNEISFAEFCRFCESQGFSQMSGLLGYPRQDVKSFKQFLSAIQNTVWTNLKCLRVLEADKDRTVGINTGHIGTSDYDLEEEDRAFIVKRGKKSMKAFYAHYLEKSRRPGLTMGDRAGGGGGAGPNGAGGDVVAGPNVAGGDVVAGPSITGGDGGAGPCVAGGDGAGPSGAAAVTRYPMSTESEPEKVTVLIH